MMLDQELREKELGLIVERRRAAGLSPRHVVEGNGASGSRPPTEEDKRQVESDLIGLALSGGGVRSAMFNLGLIRALHRSGLLRYVDCLSSVSGGSYLSGFLAARLLKIAREQTPAADGDGAGRGPLPLQQLFTTRDGGEDERVRQLIRNADYLDRPVLFAGHYVWGLLLNLIVFGSLFCLACASVAFVWRMFDHPAIYDRLRDATWYFQDSGSSGLLHFHSGLFRAFYPTAIVSLIALVYCSGYRLLAGVWPHQVLKDSGTAEQPRKQSRWSSAGVQLYYLAYLSVLISLLVVLGNGGTDRGPFNHLMPLSSSAEVLADKPGTNADRTPPDRHSGLRNVLQTLTALAVLLTAIAPFFFPRAMIQSGTQTQSVLQRRLYSLVCTAIVIGVPAWGVYWFARENVSQAAPMKRFLDLERVFDQSSTSHQRWQSVMYSQTVVPRWRIESPKDDDELENLRRKSRGEEEKISCEREKRACWWKERWGGPREKRANQPLGTVARDQWRRFVKDAPTLVRAQDDHPLTELYRRKPSSVPADSNSDDEATNNPIFAYGRWSPGEIDTPVRDRGAHCIWSGFWSRGPMWLIEADQQFRLQWIVISLAVFLTSGLVVSLNRTSMHGYYRDRLVETYIDPVPAKGDPSGSRNIRLSELQEVVREVGAPHQLFCTTLNLLGSRKTPPRVWTLVFSSLGFGSQPTGYWEIGQSAKRFDNLGEVIALSGAAVSPAQVRSRPMAALMTLLNVRLGQWIPNPAATHRLRRWATFFNLAWGSWRFAEERNHLFVTDGGHSGNLGIWPLLQRRCRLIVVADATMDSDYQFEDFFRFCRRARLDRGIRIVDPNAAGRDLDLSQLQPRRIGLSSRAAERLGRREARQSLGQYVVAKIKYPDGQDGPAKEGWLVYVKAALTGNEPLDLLNFSDLHEPFPHDPTSDQFFDEQRAESYRQLGEHIGNELTKDFEQKDFEPGELWKLHAPLSPDEVSRRLLQLALPRDIAQWIKDECKVLEVLADRLDMYRPDLVGEHDRRSTLVLTALLTARRICDRLWPQHHLQAAYVQKNGDGKLIYWHTDRSDPIEGTDHIGSPTPAAKILRGESRHEILPQLQEQERPFDDANSLIAWPCLWNGEPSDGVFQISSPRTDFWSGDTAFVERVMGAISKGWHSALKTFERTAAKTHTIPGNGWPDDVGNDSPGGLGEASILLPDFIIKDECEKIESTLAQLRDDLKQSRSS